MQQRARGELRRVVIFTPALSNRLETRITSSGQEYTCQACGTPAQSIDTSGRVYNASVSSSCLRQWVTWFPEAVMGPNK